MIEIDNFNLQSLIIISYEHEQRYRIFWTESHAVATGKLTA